MGGVGEPPVRERVGLQQVAELVVDGWPRNRPDRQQGGADREDEQSGGDTHEGSPSGEFSAESREPSEPPAAGDAPTERNKRAQRKCDRFGGELRRHSVYSLSQVLNWV